MPTCGIAEVGHGLVEELGPHGEIGVDHRDVFSIADGEGVQQVAGLLHVTRVRADDVTEAVPLSEVPYLFTDGVIEHVDGLGSAPLHFADVLEGVVQQGQRLAAAGQEDIDCLPLLPVAGHGGLVSREGQPGTADSKPEVDDDRWHYDHEQQPHERGDNPGMLRDADIAVENSGCGHQEKREHPAALFAKVLVLFLPVRRCGEVYPAARAQRPGA